MVVYLRASRLPMSLQEQVRQDITHMFLEGQERGASPDEIIGEDYKGFCDAILRELPQNTRSTHILCSIRDISLVLCAGIAALFLPDLVVSFLSHSPFLTLSLGKLIFLAVLITFAYALVEHICKNAFACDQKQDAFEKKLYLLGLLLGFVCLFFLKHPAWQIPFWAPLLVCAALLLCHGLFRYFLD
ncbi:hypothetical protein, partial [Anaerotignum sp.]|uniref:hypothetical protein n=1 Tax=Anaerotignum sp. TaxID=2039241 RepID=UPI0037350BC1